jgi:large subunit ribosomal protein L34e
MPRGKEKSKSKRKVFVRVISQTKIHYKQRKPNKKICGNCGKVLHGVPHLTQTKFKNLPKTKKRPERPYGGVLCSACMRKKLAEAIYS